MVSFKLFNPFISYVESIVIPTPTSIKICKARAMLINPPIEPMRKHKYKSIGIYIRRITLIKSILSRLVFSVFNLPCCYIETPFGNNFYTSFSSQKIQTKPRKANNITKDFFDMQIFCNFTSINKFILTFMEKRLDTY